MDNFHTFVTNFQIYLNLYVKLSRSLRVITIKSIIDADISGGSRFKSVIVENGDTLINLLAYIDLNPVRANMVERPEDYRWEFYWLSCSNK